MSTKIAAERSDEHVFHPGQAQWQSHPDHLASIATLLGMQPQPVDRCRVLELGPSARANLAPMADRHPESSFVGVDPSPAHMQAAQRAANEAGLRNIDFLARGLAEIDHSFGTFDYIICHDVLSRVAPEQQDMLLDICRARLNPHGVVYVTYRTMPGWLLAGIVRDLVGARAPDSLTVDRRVQEVRKSVRFISRAAGRDQSAYCVRLKREADLTYRLPDASLVHEYLGAESHAFYVHEFMERAADHDLQYLGDADIATMSNQGLGKAAEYNLAQVARERVSREQYQDLLRNRSLRRTLLCRKDAPLTLPWSTETLRNLRLAGDLRIEGEPGDLRSDLVTRFATGGETVISSALPAVKIALFELGRAWPCAIEFETLAKTVADRLAEGEGGPANFGPSLYNELAENLLECVAQGIVAPHTDADRFVARVSESPRASRWTQVHAESPAPIVNRRHEPIALDEMSHNLLRYLDGQRDRAALLEILAKAADKGSLSIFQGGIPTSKRESAAQILDQVLEQSLDKLARCALLVA